jgi:hypothetical protein
VVDAAAGVVPVVVASDVAV